MSISTLKVHSLQKFSLNFAANIIAAFWMLLGSVRAFLWVKPSFVQFFVFLLSALLANALFGWLASDMGSEFNQQGLISYLVFPMIMLVAGIIIAKRSNNEVLTFVPVILWLTADTMLVLVQSFVQFLGLQSLLPDWSYDIIPLFFIVVFVWQTASLLLIFAKKLYWNWWERGLMLVGAIALLVVWQKNITEPIFKVTTLPPTLTETAFYLQPQLLNNAINGINKGVVGRSEWYFLGVAGYAEQDVFANEVMAARQLFDIRFGTAHRSAALLNNTYLWEEAPVATRTSVTRLLETIGKQMNSEEDVLFMVLSSHGVVGEDGLPTGELAMVNPPLATDPIDGKWLKETLDTAGIRWRVIVVSACYSGAFIEELASPTTVVITAAARDKASFGCTNDADLTYFGRAFFDESMRGASSFDKAFAQAARRVAEKEALMGLPASEPQMAVGELMQTALPEFEKVLFGHGDTQALSLSKPLK